MKNKTLEFVKNSLISGVPFTIGGILGADIAQHYLPEHERLVSWISTASEYTAGYSTFMLLHARDNPEKYKTDGKWSATKIAKGLAKTTASLFAAELVYLGVRPWILEYFLNKGYDTNFSSIASDVVSSVPYFAAAIPIAKKTGLIASEKSLEKKVE